MPEHTPTFVLALFLCLWAFQPALPQVVSVEEELRLLVFTKTEGFRHQSIPAGVKAVRSLAGKNGWDVHHTEDASHISDDTLGTYRVVLFLNTTGNILNTRQEEALKAYILGGGGFMGVHSATDTEFSWEWYGDMIGAYFDSHPKVQQGRLRVVDGEHPSTSHLPAEWVRTDEWYNFRDISGNINVLLNLVESSYRGGKNGKHHPAAWYREVGRGRMFYTAGGHTSESYREPLFLEHLWGGIRYVAGGE